MAFFTLHLFSKCKQNLFLLSPATFFPNYSQGVCQAGRATGLLKSMTLFLIFWPAPQNKLYRHFWQDILASLRRYSLSAKDSHIPTNKKRLPQMYVYNEPQTSVACSKRLEKSPEDLRFCAGCVSVYLQPGSRNAAVWSSRHRPLQAHDYIILYCIIFQLWAVPAPTGQSDWHDRGVCSPNPGMTPAGRNRKCVGAQDLNPK